jgi:ferritin-like metal-binding protein YciE
MRSIEDLFHALVQDVYFAEKHWLKSLAVLANACEDPLLRNAFNIQRFESGEQIARLDQVFEIAGRRARGRHCDAVLGIAAEAESLIGRTTLGSVRDAGILSAAQAAAHYQIARYGTLLAWTERLNDRQSARLLRRSLEEKRGADAMLGQIAASSINHAAQAA